MAYTWKSKNGKPATPRDDRETMRRRSLETGRLAEAARVNPPDMFGQPTCPDCKATLADASGSYKCACNGVRLPPAEVHSTKDPVLNSGTDKKRSGRKREKREKGK